MFVGAINGQVRSILSRFSKSLSGQPVYVGCSGNFTVERVLSSTGTGEFHSNDVSLYSCALGSHLAGDSIDVHVTDDELSWMGEYLQPGVPSIATLLLCSEMLQHYQRPEPYHRRMWKAYQSRFAVMHDATLQKVEKAIDGLVINSFSPSDVVEFVSQAPEDAVVVCFPPTYKGGYERLYKVMDSVFAWDAPAYATFDEDRFVELAEMVKARPVWMTLRDQPEPVLDGYLTGVVQTGLRSKPVYVYSSEHDTTLAMPRQTIETIPLPRLEDEVDGGLSLVRMSQGQLNQLRSEYLSLAITPAAAQVSVGVKVGGHLIGALAFSRSNSFRAWCDAYMLTDLAVRPTVYRRLAKLVLAAALSMEMKAVLEQSLNMPVATIGTTAFTNRPVSMKYRGLFDLYSKKEGALNYQAHAGRWNLAEGFEWWRKNHSQR